MAVLRKWATTVSVDLAVAAMGLQMEDDDKTDVFVSYTVHGVCFTSWGGVARGFVTPIQNACCEKYQVEMSTVGSAGAINKSYDRKDVQQMTKDIYDYIQVNSRNGQ